MTNEYVESRINLINNRSDIRKYKEEVKDLKFQRAILLIVLVGMTVMAIFRG
ncbi:hypothetical protein [uncultured Parvimonas sp.]|uniref:hypothetical protein n=1 Tax=uncultured Parvimonas sp. TaxID=747372 RepID=UPI002595CFE8|nr:hypothetical protein [uncultured Parvimonas sp.]